MSLRRIVSARAHTHEERERALSRVLALAPPAKLFMNNQHQKASAAAAAAANKSKY